MSDETEPRRPRVVLRARSAYLLFGLVAIILVGLAADGFARGALMQTLLVLPWFIATLWFIYVVLLRPCVVLDEQGITVINVYRRHSVPWPRLAEVTSRYQLTLTLQTGKKISSWGAPTTGLSGSSRRRGRFTASDVGRLPGLRSFFERPTPTGETLSTIEDHRAHWGPTAADAPARSGWEWWTIAVSALVVAACVWAVVATR